jgi:hypothetical protein
MAPNTPLWCLKFPAPLYLTLAPRAWGLRGFRAFTPQATPLAWHKPDRENSQFLPIDWKFSNRPSLKASGIFAFFKRQTMKMQRRRRRTISTNTRSMQRTAMSSTRASASLISMRRRDAGGPKPNRQATPIYASSLPIMQGSRPSGRCST